MVLATVKCITISHLSTVTEPLVLTTIKRIIIIIYLSLVTGAAQIFSNIISSLGPHSPQGTHAHFFHNKIDYFFIHRITKQLVFPRQHILMFTKIMFMCVGGVISRLHLLHLRIV